MRLTSAKNPLLQKLRRAAAAGRPTEEGLIVAEGPHLLEEARRGTWKAVQVFATSEAQSRYRNLLDRLNAELIEVSPHALASTAATETSQQILTLLRPREWSWRDIEDRTLPLVILDGIQDPGNAGTIVRSAEAFGASGVVLLAGCVRVANGKFLRASAGSIFRIPFLENVRDADLYKYLEDHRLILYALDAKGQRNLTETDLRDGYAVAVGSEAAGVSANIKSKAITVSIPTTGVESLNAGVAASIALFEAARQRANR